MKLVFIRHVTDVIEERENVLLSRWLNSYKELILC